MVTDVSVLIIQFVPRVAMVTGVRSSVDVKTEPIVILRTVSVHVWKAMWASIVIGVCG